MANLRWRRGFGYLGSGFLAAAGLAGSSPIWASYGNDNTSLYDLSLEDLSEIRVVTASRTEQHVSGAPGIVSVITAQDIERFGANSLIEVVERFPGVTALTGYVFQNNALSVRGDLPNQNDTHLLVLINGRPFRTGFSGSFNGTILDNFPLRAIERLEFVRGPGSVLYGSNAYSGVLNIITRKSQDSGARVALGAGSFATRQAAVSAGLKGDLFSGRIDATAFREDGWHGTLTDEAAAADSADFGEDNLAVSASGQLGGFSVDAFVADTEQTHLGAAPLWPEATIDRDVYYLGAGYVAELSPDWQLNTSLSYTGSRQTYPVDPAGAVRFDGEADELHLEAFGVGSLGADWDLTLGANLTYLQGEINADGAITLAPYDLLWSSVFAQVDFRASDSVRLFAGGQYHKAEGIDGNFVPRLGAIWHYHHDMGIKLLYSEAFRSPYPAETDVVAQVVVGNPALEPETVQTLDLQWFLQRSDLQLAFTVFDSRQDDLIRRIQGTPGTFVNAGELELRGVELEGRWRFSPRWLVTGSFTAQRNEDGNGLDDVSLAPDYLAKLGLAWTPRQGVSIGVFDNYTDAYQDVAVIWPSRAAVNPAADAYHLVSANVRLHLPSLLPGQGLPDTTLNLYGSNLLDEDIYVPEYSRGFINTLPARAGRAWYLTLEVAI